MRKVLVFMDANEAPSAWENVSRWLPARNENYTFWWLKTGPQLAALLLQSGYSIHQQYEALLFHYHVVVPCLGRRPISVVPSMGPTPEWKSFMTDDFSPIEYSWKWDTGDESSGPVIRYGIEAIGPYAGTALDPLNQTLTKELLYQLSQAIPGIDTTWFHHFATVLYGSEQPELTPERHETLDIQAPPRSSMFLAFELLKGQLAVKAYFIPPNPTKMSEAKADVLGRLSRVTQSLSVPATAQGEASQWVALDEMVSFMDTSEHGKNLIPFMIGIDCVRDSKSRLKVYVRSSDTSFDSVVQVLTMGGRRQGVDKSITDLKELWRLTLGLPADFSTSENLSPLEHATGGMCYFFDIQPGIALPDIKMYIPVRHYGQSDLEIAYGLRKFLQTRGRGAYVEGYLKSLEEFAPFDRLQTSCGIQTYISCAFQKKGLSITSYLSPNIYQG
ncbi:hypothetical protein MGYG_04085 [Nannizzia gypsea CBS 118893]|uniref:Prenyltransferase nscD n=1 Tax=Arthroderma gypseum (strain ATCC MYA-4604 / CBS 118893) TaxID=535722 RepID=E4UUW5_ARTGP|nr:hypothetical protein MGYG_04085 [Nannizzia gypsea CBS 118893]EFR01082.1 hypothetical protein MGYG_04085 [Nannizzia gypsea CBS 118893]